MNNRKFEKFYKKNIDRIYRYVFFRIGQNHDVCEDLVSEIFLKAVKNFEKYDPKISESAWIYTIAHNHLANHYRDKKDSVDIEDVAYSLIGEDGNKSIQNKSHQLALLSALDQLSKEKRRFVTMKYIEGYTFKEISEISHKSLSAVKMSTRRAIKELRELCKKYV
jgi:RNA polymerase sigma-70 factor, ECF subfamily